MTNAAPIHPYLEGVDRALMDAMPTLVQPRFGQLPDIAAGQTRLIVASNGIYIECLTNALYARLRISEIQESAKLPFGLCDAAFRLVGGPIPAQVLSPLLDGALAAGSIEHAGLVSWTGEEYRLHTIEPSEASAGRVRYKRPEIDPLSIVLDVHTHGHGHAYFSGTDDADDEAEQWPLFVSSVLGGCQSRETLRATARVVCNSRLFRSNYNPWSACGVVRASGVWV